MRPRSKYGLALFLGALVALAAGGYLLRRGAKGPLLGGDSLPKPGSDRYAEMVSAFYAGEAALGVDANDHALKKLTKATQLVPQEPAAWADLGLVQLRLGNFDAAARDLEQARALAPESAAVEQLLGLLEGRRGRFSEAIAHLRRAVALDPADLKARFSLAREVERQADPDSESEALRLMGEILERQPGNLVVLLERARLAAKCADVSALKDSVARLGPFASTWPARTQEQYRTLEQAAGEDLRLAATRVAFLRNVLAPLPAFRQSLDAVETPIGVAGEPIGRFLKLAAPTATPSPPDDALAFAAEPVPDPDASRWDALRAVYPAGVQPPALFVANGRELRRIDGPGIALPFPGGPSAVPPTSSGILGLDLNSDYRMDFALAGAGGLRIYQQKEDGTFADVTAATGLDANILSAPAAGAWAADIEMDGDLDIVLGGQDGPPAVLRNNSDGTFRLIRPFEGAPTVRDFAWADLDEDGDPDAALLDAKGELWIYTNERAGRFVKRPGPADLNKLVALAVADLNSDRTLDLLALRADGAVLRISNEDVGSAWKVVEVARAPSAIEGPTRLFAADLDNNGSPDLIASGSQGAWLGLANGKGGFSTLAAPAGLRVFAVEDLNGDGRLDLAGLSADGRAVRAIGRGAKNYHWQVIRPRAARAFGDGRINSFGVGGEVEIRAGLLFQKQMIAGPILHFGLGDHLATDVVRVIWPNGTVQAEFEIKADQELIAEQRLKGSCPFLFAFDGTRMRFVTDFIWRSPLGLRINAQDTAGAAQTEDWVKIRADQLAPRDGHYELSITAELWETHFFDYMSLMVVDHPADTEIFVDERFARRPPPLVVRATGPLHPVSYAQDDKGPDVTETVSARDGRYLDTFGRGFYQGVTRDHWVEAEIGEDVPRDKPLVLVAHGWIHPTDSSINVAIGQGKHPAPQGLVLEVPTPDGKWTVARPDLGFPSGKNKTILVDLDRIFRPGAPRRFRLRTNLEIYWDSLAVAEALPAPSAVAAPGVTLKTQRLSPSSAELRPRGYSLMTRADDSSPELPTYETLTGTAQRWRDLIGYYTRFGDVRHLLKVVDDRYVIANAGDELALRFPAPPPPPAGWVRDFVMIGDGWNKDGDYNTAFSKTVLPLPSHKRPNYDTAPGALEDDPVYRANPEDWRVYHTRFITPSTFQSLMKPRMDPEPSRVLESNP
jgi:tetratricopeptide (TPR) repeat protein